jgi:superfamily II DNA or RNA helicase
MNKYNEFYLNSNLKNMNSICNIEKIEFQKHQKFCRKWFENGNSKLLLFNGLGSGKSLSSIFIAEGLLNSKQINHVYAVTPASLRKNFENELTMGLMSNTYNKLPTTYSIISYNKFVQMYEEDSLKLKNSLVIIDEVQNIISPTGKMYKIFFDALVTNEQRNSKVVLLSGTPMFDQPIDIALTMNLLNVPDPFHIEKFSKEFLNENKMINQSSFMKKVHPYVSAFKGVSPKAYAKRKDIYVNCPMKYYQKAGYELTVSKSNLTAYSQAFLSAPRIASNLVYYNLGVGKKYRSTGRLKEILAPKMIQKYSSKFYSCLKHIQFSDKQTFIYSNFVASGGVNDFILAMKLHGIPSSKYGVFQTNEDEKNKRLINNFNNGKIQIIIGSPAMKEGISLKNCREVHILDPYWNSSRVNQVIGRAIRFCSHVSLPRNERNVKVFHYIATIKNYKSVDEHIKHIAQDKQTIISQFENVLYKAAVDCPLFHTSTGFDKLDCYKGVELSNISKLQSSFNVQKQSNTYVSINNEKEKNLLQIIKTQQLNKNKNLKFNVYLYATENLKFLFNNSQLNTFIGKISYQKSDKMIVKLKIKLGIKEKKIPKMKKPMRKINFSSVPKLSFIKKPPKEKTIKCTHNPDEDGKCINKKFPFKRGECCFSRPAKSSIGILKGGDKTYVNGKYTKTMTLDQLTKAALKYDKLLRPKMKRLNLINVLGR